MQTLTRRCVLRAGLSAGLLAGTHARACEFWTSNLRILHPWTRETADDAKTAVVSMKFDQVADDDRLLGVETPVATGAELGGSGAKPEVDFVIPKGRESFLGEQGTFVRLLGLQHPLYVGRTYPMRLHFERGGIVSADLSVDFGRFY